MSTLLDHVTGNPLLVVQRRLGHAHPSTTYRYIRYLKDPMREVDDAFQHVTAAGGASYIAIARSLMDLEDAGHAPTRPLHPLISPTSVPRPAAPSRVGVRGGVDGRWSGPPSDGRRSIRHASPARSWLGELADEWVELVEDARYGPTSATHYRQTIEAFCTHVDATVPRPHRASLAGTDPDLHHAVTEWVRLLPSRHRPGSRSPAWRAGRLRTLIGRRSLHGRSVSSLGTCTAGSKAPWDCAAGRPGCELDEFSRADRKKIVQAAWTARLDIERRLARRWDLAARGRDPRGVRLETEEADLPSGDRPQCP
ncbi:hypothetical protein QQY24_00120 [Streptomyces sp. TG1A-8]|uniref:hypothetical protein n=1 Tax=Streptomyces sp. TG1A-8 TaxID=3051385 RepID=UPI00265C5DCE|nr:hypothetical protein [Streptomyces sp. TG1A-8]MDO0923937.1 hypothetical protein [Streptomyces sp. TG1A-8]